MRLAADATCRWLLTEQDCGCDADWAKAAVFGVDAVSVRSGDTQPHKNWHAVRAAAVLINNGDAFLVVRCRELNDIFLTPKLAARPIEMLNRNAAAVDWIIEQVGGCLVLSRTDAAFSDWKKLVSKPQSPLL
jgi:hypothetical protein